MVKTVAKIINAKSFMGLFEMEYGVTFAVEDRISCVLLAAGLSRRMGEDKLMLPYRGRALLQHAVQLLGDLPVFERIIVTSEGRLGRIELPPGVRAVINPRPEEGQSGSLRLGLEAASGEWYLFLAADQPLLTVSDLQPLLDLADDRARIIAFPSINGEPRMPALFSACFRDELLSVRGDSGGREVRESNPGSCIEVAPEHPERFLDIDDVGDYKQIRNSEFGIRN